MTKATAVLLSSLLLSSVLSLTACATDDVPDDVSDVTDVTDDDVTDDVTVDHALPTDSRHSADTTDIDENDESDEWAEEIVLDNGAVVTVIHRWWRGRSGGRELFDENAIPRSSTLK